MQMTVSQYADRSEVQRAQALRSSRTFHDGNSHDNRWLSNNPAVWTDITDYSIMFHDKL